MGQMAKTALITGISGQDGAYLAKALLERGYRVIGTYRRTSAMPTSRLDELGVAQHVEFVDMELLEESNIRHVLQKLKPDEIYNLAAQSFVALSFEQPLYTCDVDAMGVLRLLEAVREACPETRLYQASTSEMFGKVQEVPQSEHDALLSAQPLWRGQAVRPLERGELPRGPWPLRLLGHPVQPRVPLAWPRIRDPQGDPRARPRGARAAGRAACRQSRGEAGLGLRRRICGWHVADAAAGHAGRLCARDRAHHHRARFVDGAAAAFGFALEWNGDGESASGIDKKTGRTIVAVDPLFYRPAEVDFLLGDASKAKAVLGWEAKTSLEELIQMMARADYDRVKTGLARA